ncbi:16687_t:CDS:2 [Entrophospora sp. SA101]|nr:16687_t:CDS:2 [Entrophospora sp. SA101]CAJ0840971.1 18445_t:CDS:2 [Entrophospora sp. SA101]
MKNDDASERYVEEFYNIENPYENDWFFFLQPNLKDIRDSINTTDERSGKIYDKENYYDIDYIRFALYAMSAKKYKSGGLKNVNWNHGIVATCGHQ